MDDTLLGRDGALERLMGALTAARKQLVIVYNSSRPCASLRQTMRKTPELLTPDYLVGAMGTEIEEGESGTAVTNYAQYLGRGWDRTVVVDLINHFGFPLHPPEFLTRYKISCNVPDEASYYQFKEQLVQTGLRAKAILSNNNSLDVIPQDAGKGAVITFLYKWLHIDPDHIVASGDSGNDLEMFVPPNKGIAVANSTPDVKQLTGAHMYHARETHAAGVLEGLQHWGVL